MSLRIQDNEFIDQIWFILHRPRIVHIIRREKEVTLHVTKAEPWPAIYIPGSTPYLDGCVSRNNWNLIILSLCRPAPHAVDNVSLVPVDYGMNLTAWCFC